jgi:putative glutamine amidotransferase
LKLDQAYSKAIEAAGGFPVLIPPQSDLDQIVEMIGGLLVPGGDDIDPCYYGEARHEKTLLIPSQRFDFDSAMMKRVEAAGKPVLGICYGSQLMNVLRGGSLHQHLPDLPDTLRHRRETTGDEHPHHFVHFGKDSRLCELLEMEQFDVLSMHHQAIHQAGEGLRIVATAPDGVAEAVEDPGKEFFIGVQWHPERTPESAATRQLFKVFVDACR